MDREKQTLALDWQGMTLSVTFVPAWFGTDYSHIEVRSPDRRPLPISETGYRSIFVSASILAEWDGPLPYVTAMLDDEATRPAWLAGHARRQQLTLF